MRRMSHTPARSPREQQVFAACGGSFKINGRENAPFLQTAGEVQFHISGAFELFVDHVIQTGTGIDQSSGDDGQRSAAFDVAGCAVEAFGRIKRRGSMPPESVRPGIDYQVIARASV
jgi:hypothetical protein